MTLADLIAALEAADPRLVVPNGFTNPHSYRGYYDDLAFEPAQNVTVAAMLTDARSALGATYEGYKGGEYTMSEWTDCWLAEYGSGDGETLGPLLVRLMLATAMPERDASDVMGPAEVAELEAVVSEPFDPADYVEAARPEPDPADPRQIAVSLMLSAARDPDSADIWDAIDRARPDITSIDRASLIQTILELAETADITIGWSEATPAK